MKSFLLFSVLTLGLFLPHFLNAANDYIPLAPLPGLSDQELNAGGEPIGNYFSTMYKIGVSLVLLIAVVMLMYGGIRYMTSDSIGGKGGAREAITKAIIGILLALGSYALLYLIGGPGSVSVSLDFPKVGYEAPPGLSCKVVAHVKKYLLEQGEARPTPQCSCDKDKPGDDIMTGQCKSNWRGVNVNEGEDIEIILKGGEAVVGYTCYDWTSTTLGVTGGAYYKLQVKELGAECGGPITVDPGT